MRILQPYQGRGGQVWYAGTADAIYQNLNYIREQGADTVVILSGDHIYKMDYRPMIEFHKERNADLTIALMPVPLEETNRFGIMTVDEEDHITAFFEKPKDRDKGNLASMGIYVFKADVLAKRLSEGNEQSPRTDFGKHVIPAMLEAGDSILAYRFRDYWVDVGTVDSYWATNLELVQANPALDLYSEKWPLHTRSEERPPVKSGPQARINQSMVSNGCVVRGTVINSVLSPGVYISPGAVVKDSILMNDTWVGAGAHVERAVIDKQVVIGAGAQIGLGDPAVPNERMPDKLFAGITVIGKNADIPDGARIGCNVLINSDRGPRDFPEDGLVKDGMTI